MTFESSLLKTSPKFSTNYHGVYETLNFVVRLSPVNHILVDEITANPKQISFRHIQAYSTFLHETVHWWQHMGSTAGLVYSLAHPSMTHASYKNLKAIARTSQPSKSIKGISDQILLKNGAGAQNSLYNENIAVNNALDISFYQQIVTNSSNSLPDLYKMPHFESTGHCYYIAFSNVMLLISSVIDKEFTFLPDPRNWETPFQEISASGAIEYTYASGRLVVCHVGLREIFEGQAIFSQIQFITLASNQSFSINEFVNLGILHGVYIAAFELFIKITKYSYPDDPLDKKVSLFLLICDLAINPNIGVVDEIAQFDNFLNEVDPARRFLSLCRAAAGTKIYEKILHHSKQEYEEIELFLTHKSGLDSVMKFRSKIANEWTLNLGVEAALEDVRSLCYDKENIVARFCVSHFLRFTQDAYRAPEFFCWPAIWKSKGRGDNSIEQLWLKHLSVFTDREDKIGIYPHEWPDREPSNVIKTMENFYGAIIMDDMTHQWILKDGPFHYDYDSFTEDEVSNHSIIHLQDLFERLYGVHPNNITVLNTQPR